MTYDWKKADHANKQVSLAVKRGLLVRGACAHADQGGCDGRIEGHHEDYDEPLNVIWLCVRHHVNLHTERRRAEKKRPPRDLAVVIGTGTNRKEA